MRKRLLSFMMASLMLISVFGNISAYAEGEARISITGSKNQLKLVDTEVRSQESISEINIENETKIKLEINLGEYTFVEIFKNDIYLYDNIANQTDKNIVIDLDINPGDILEFGFTKKNQDLHTIMQYKFYRMHDVNFIIGNGNYLENKIKHGEKLTNPDIKEFDLENNKFKIIGWSLGKSNIEKKWDFEKDTVKENLNLYAILEKIEDSQPPVNPQPQPPAVIGGGAPNSSVRPDTANNANNAGETVINENATPLAEFGDNFIARFKINSKEYSVNENDKAVSKMTDIAPMISQNRTLLPVRLTGEVLGVKADYDNAIKMAKFTYMGADNKENVIEMTAGQKMMKVNGQEVALTADIMIVNGRIMLPVSDVQRALKDLGLQIELQWNHETKEVTIVKSAK